MTDKCYFESLHFLRGIAALLVAGDHLLGKTPAFAWLDNVGDWGVTCFFVISGFAVSHSLRDSYELKDFGRFFLRRLVRIQPTYAASLAIHCALVAILTRLNPRAIPWSPSEWQLLSHMFYLVPFTNGEWLVPAYWTLAVEFQFYLAIGLLYPAVLHAGRRSPHGVLLCMVLFAALPYLWPLYEAIGLLQHGPFFALGVLLAQQPSKQRTRWPLWCAILAIGALAFMSELEAERVCAGLATTAIIHFWSAEIRFSHNVVRGGLFLGTISYSWYLVHTTVGLAGESGARFLSKLSAFPFQQSLVDLAPFASFAASIPVAWLLYAAVEGPTHRLARKIAARTASRPLQPT